MKIGVLTFHNSNNYGAVFQAYALQKYLNKFNDYELINYNSKVISAEAKISKLRNLHGVKGFVKNRYLCTITLIRTRALEGLSVGANYLRLLIILKI